MSKHGNLPRRRVHGHARLIAVALLLAVLLGDALPTVTPVAAAGPSVTLAAIRTLRTGDNPQGVAANPATNRVYVTSHDGSSYSTPDIVTVVDGTTDAVVTTIPVGYEAKGVAVNAITNRIYVANFGNDNISVIDGRTNTVIKTIPVGRQPRGIAVNPSTNRIYVTNEADDTVSAIDGGANAVVKTIPVGAAPLGVAVNPGTNRIYVANSYDFDVSVINGSTSAVIATVPVTGFPAGIAVNSATNRVYITSWSATGDKVSVINGSTNAVGPVIAVGNVAEEFGIAVNPVLNRAYVASPSLRAMKVIDGGTNAVIATVFREDTFYPIGVAANQKTGRVYAADNGGGTLTVFQDPLIPPAAPSNVVASRVPLDPTSAQLTWVDNSPNNSNWSPEDAFFIYENGALIDAVRSNITSRIVSGLTPGTYRCFVVAARNDAGQGGLGNGGACVTLETGKPNAPGNIAASALSGTQIKLTWADNAPSATNEFAEDGFYVYEKGERIATLPPNARTHTVANITPGTSHCYVVTAYNGWGESGLGNAAACAKTTGTLPAGQYRIELSWGSAPLDLDGHLWLPTATPAEIFYADRGSATALPFAVQDTDDTNGMGPEKITIVQVQTGVYTYGVYNYSNERALAGSNATVKVYRGSTLMRTIVVPSGGSGRWWAVLTLNGDGTLQTVNTLSDTSPAPY